MIWRRRRNAARSAVAKCQKAASDRGSESRQPPTTIRSRAVIGSQ